MITGALKSQVDQVWNAFWSGVIANLLTVIEQITYLSNASITTPRQHNGATVNTNGNGT
jgi:hypothetical protein